MQICQERGNMRKSKTLLELEKIRVPEPKFDDETVPLGELAVQARRKMVNRLRLRGYKNQEIAGRLNCSISTVEKINHHIRENGKEWYENECVDDYCESLQNSIVICDNAIEDLQILYDEVSDLDSKLKILEMISEFEQRKTELFSKTKGVKRFLN